MSGFPGWRTLVAMKTFASPSTRRTARPGQPTNKPIARLALAYLAALLFVIGATAVGDGSSGDPFARPDAPVAGF